MDYPVHLSNQLPQYLRSLRKSRGLTQTELARRLGVVQSRVADIERDPGSVSVEQLLQLLSILGAQLLIQDLEAAAATTPPATPPDDDGPRGAW
ncbi:transcriptional regulator [Rubrivivax gelatinosus]|nr:transcriptional regulator [Rubrivivax gelatinosus]